MALRDHAIWWPGLLTLPALIGQAVHARRSTPRLPSAPSPHAGTCTPKKLSDTRGLSLYLIGESTVAGVGARTHELALSGQLARRLAEALARPVHWEALGLIGARARDCLELQVELELIPRLERAPANLIVVALGVNDTTKLTRRATWRETLYRIVRRLREKTSCPILFTSLPPMEHFRALPQPLRMMLGARARMLDGDIARVAKTSSGVHHHRAELEFEPGYLASDGFHPSELGYVLWGAQLAEQAAVLLTQTLCKYPSRFSTSSCFGDVSAEPGLRVTVRSDGNSLLDAPRS